MGRNLSRASKPVVVALGGARAQGQGGEFGTSPSRLASEAAPPPCVTTLRPCPLVPDGWIEHNFPAADREYDIYSRLLNERIVFLGTPIDDPGRGTSSWRSCLHLESTDPEKDISIYINSPGGDVYSGLAIYDTMQFIKAGGADHLLWGSPRRWVHCC